MTNPSYCCPKCEGQIISGIAIDPGPGSGCFYTPPPITYENIELIPVFKCMSCGYSCDDYRDLEMKND